MHSRTVFFMTFLAGMMLACSQIFGPSPSTGKVKNLQVQVPVSQAFYGAPTCGPTEVLVEITLEGQPQEVGLQYRYAGVQTSAWEKIQAARSAPGKYVAILPLNAGRTFFGGQAGRVDFQAYAVTPDGQVLTAPDKALSLSVQPCTQAGAPSGQATGGPTVLQVVDTGAPLAASAACGNPTLEVTAIVSDPAGRPQVTLEYWVEDETGRPITQTQTMPMQGQGTTYRATVNASALAAALQGKAGYLGYRVVAQGASGAKTVHPGENARLIAAIVACTAQAGGAAAPNQPPAKPPTRQAPGGNQGGNQGGSQGGNQGGNQGSGIRITNLGYNNMDPNGRVYYGNCTQGETTWVEVQAEVQAPSSIDWVRLEYTYGRGSVPAQPNFNYAMDMGLAQGIGPYSAQIDTANDLLTPGQTYDWIAYRIQARTKDGKSATSGVYTIPLTPCSGSTGGGSGTGGTVQIQNLYADPQTAYTDAACGATNLTVYVKVNDASQVQQATLTYGVAPQPNMPPPNTDTVNMLPDFWNADTFAADLDATTLGEGYLWVSVEIQTTSGQTVTQTQGYAAQILPCQSASPPTILYFESLNENNQVQETIPVLLRWETENATCGVYLNGAPVNEDEPNEYVAAQTALGMAGTTFTYTLEARGGDCTNPQVVTATVSVTVVPYDDTGGNDGSGATACTAGYDGMYIAEDRPIVLDLDCDGSAETTISLGQSSDFEVRFAGGRGTGYGYGSQPSPQECLNAVQTGSINEIPVESGETVCYEVGSMVGRLTISWQDMDAGMVSVGFYAEVISP